VHLKLGDKPISLASFDGEFNIHGTPRSVCYVGVDGDEPSVLVIKGLTPADALHILDQLHDGLLKGKDAENPKVDAKPDKVVKSKPPAEVIKEAKAQAVTTIAEIPKPAPEKTPVPVETKAEKIEVVEGGELDIAAMSKMEKLRDVIEHMASCGYKTPAQVVAASLKVLDQVPALQEVDKKGNFEKRMERGATVVLGIGVDAA